MFYENEERADENILYATAEEFLEDKKKFVRNLGELLSQTRERITGAHLTDEDTVVIHYRGDHFEEINVKDDSYMATLREVINAIAR